MEVLPNYDFYNCLNHRAWIKNKYFAEKDYIGMEYWGASCSADSR